MASKLTKCEKCQKELSRLASVCPGCGARRKLPRLVVVGLVALVGLILVIAAAGALGPKKEKPPATETQAVTSPTSARPAKPSGVDSAAAVEVTAGALYEEYKANAIGADAKYRDKALRVTGVIDRVGKGHDEKPFVVFWVLEAGDDGLRASFSTAAGLAELKQFQAVAVRCRGGSSAGLPTLSGCAFERMVDEEPGSGSAGR
jgi:hypothetical protein